MAYRPVHEKFWRDPAVNKLNIKTKLLFVYFITSADAHFSGVYYCPIQMIKLETGLSEKEVIEGIDTLSAGYMIRYDKGTNEVFVTNMAKFQVKSDTQIKGVIKHFKESVQSKVLIKHFIDKYPEFEIPYRYPIDTTETETDTETETERDIKNDKKPDNNFLLFEDAWTEYPKHRGCKTEYEHLKKKWKDWKEIIPTLKGCIVAYNAFIKKEQLTKPDYPVKMMQYWINDRRWEMHHPEETKPKITKKFKDPEGNIYEVQE